MAVALHFISERTTFPYVVSYKNGAKDAEQFQRGYGKIIYVLLTN
jgi:hypothetical protein